MLAERLASEEALKDELAAARQRIPELGERAADAGTAQAGLEELRKALADKEALLDAERRKREEDRDAAHMDRVSAETSWQGKVETLLSEVGRLKQSCGDADAEASALRKRVGELELDVHDQAGVRPLPRLRSAGPCSS